MIGSVLAALLLLATAVDTAALKTTAVNNEGGANGPVLNKTMFHVLGLPHTLVRPDFSACAFTTVIGRMCRMLQGLGLHSVLYANEGSQSFCDEEIPMLTQEEYNHIYDYDWKKGGWFNDGEAEGINKFNARAIMSLQNKVAEHPDYHHILLCFWGEWKIASAAGITAIEASIGYDAELPFAFKVFTSYHQMTKKTPNKDIEYYHTAIPLCYFPDEFDKTEPYVDPDGPYFLFVGKIKEDKGVYIVNAIMEQMPDYKLHVAGQGNHEVFFSGKESLSKQVVYHGVVQPKERNALMKGATAVITPTIYKEPFGSVMVESQWLGTPVITTDHAAFVETIWHGETGYRCRTLRCFVGAAQKVHHLDQNRIAARAQATYNCRKVMHQYEDYFQDVINLSYSEGWNRLTGGPGHTLDKKDFYPGPVHEQCFADFAE